MSQNRSILFLPFGHQKLIEQYYGRLAVCITNETRNFMFSGIFPLKTRVAFLVFVRTQYFCVLFQQTIQSMSAAIVCLCRIEKQLGARFVRVRDQKEVAVVTVCFVNRVVDQTWKNFAQAFWFRFWCTYMFYWSSPFKKKRAPYSYLKVEKKTGVEEVCIVIYAHFEAYQRAYVIIGMNVT